MQAQLFPTLAPHPSTPTACALGSSGGEGVGVQEVMGGVMAARAAPRHPAPLAAIPLCSCSPWGWLWEPHGSIVLEQK